LDTTTASCSPATPPDPQCDSGAVLTFISDTNEAGLTGFNIAPNSPVENGGRQEIVSLTWQDPGNPAETANILAASDVTEVPEPPTVMLLVTGLGLLGGMSYRRRVRATSWI
jgi:hypothetical protein